MGPSLKRTLFVAIAACMLTLTGLPAGAQVAAGLRCMQQFEVVTPRRPAILEKAAAYSAEVSKLIAEGYFQNAAFVLYRNGETQLAKNLEKWILHEIQTGEVQHAQERDSRRNASRSIMITFTSGLQTLFKLDATLANDDIPSHLAEALVNPPFEVAAYELDRMIGLNAVPVAGLKTFVFGSRAFSGSVHALLKTQAAQPIGDSKFEAREDAIRKIKIFDFLVSNFDRNPGNYLLSDGFTYAIDHGAAFQRKGAEIGRFPPLRPQQLPADARYAQLLSAIEALPEETLRAMLAKYLDEPRIKEFLERRNQLIGQYHSNIARRITVPDYDIEMRRRVDGDDPFNPLMMFWAPWLGR